MQFEFTPYVVAVPLISLFFMVYAWNHAMRGTKTIWEAGLWTLFWGGVSTVVLLPDWITYLTTWTGIKDRENAVFAIAIGVLLFMVFHLIVRIEKLNNRITDLVRRQALHNSGMEATDGTGATEGTEE